MKTSSSPKKLPVAYELQAADVFGSRDKAEVSDNDSSGEYLAEDIQRLRNHSTFEAELDVRSTYSGDGRLE